MNNSAAHILVHKCAYLCISIGYVTGCKNASFIENLIFSFSRYYQIVLQNGVLIDTPKQQSMRVVTVHSLQR